MFNLRAYKEGKTSLILLLITQITESTKFKKYKNWNLEKSSK